MLVVISYNNPHKKTQDLLLQLKARGHQEVLVLASPWKERKNYLPLYQHRPSKAIPISLEKLCENLNYQFIASELDDFPKHLENKNTEAILIAGAGILDKKLTSNYKIINAHPALLPYAKGLDALKWAIYKEYPIGVTIHFISDKTDEGLVIAQQEVPLFYEDTFHSFAYRQYEMEIEMMIDSLAIIKKETTFKNLKDTDEFKAHRRMPHHLELKMMDTFETRRKKAPSIREMD